MATTDLAGRTALVTGARRGIGFAIATALLEHGASVVVGGRDPDQFEGLRRRLDEIAPGRVHGMRRGPHHRGRACCAPRCGAEDRHPGQQRRRIHRRRRHPDVDRGGVERAAPSQPDRSVPALSGRAPADDRAEVGSDHQHRFRGRHGAATRQRHRIRGGQGGGFTKQLAAEVAALGVTANVVNPGTIKTEHLGEYFGPPGSPRSRSRRASRWAGSDGRTRSAVVPFLASEQGAFTTGAVIDINGGAVSA